MITKLIGAIVLAMSLIYGLGGFAHADVQCMFIGQTYVCIVIPDTSGYRDYVPLQDSLKPIAEVYQ